MKYIGLRKAWNEKRLDDGSLKKQLKTAHERKVEERRERVPQRYRWEDNLKRLWSSSRLECTNRARDTEC